MPQGSPALDRVLLHVAGSRRLAIEPDEVYVLEADGDDTIVRRRGRRTIRDVRRLLEVSAEFERRHLHRIHSMTRSGWAVATTSGTG